MKDILSKVFKAFPRRKKPSKSSIAILDTYIGPDMRLYHVKKFKTDMHDAYRANEKGEITEWLMYTGKDKDLTVVTTQHAVVTDPNGLIRVFTEKDLRSAGYKAILTF